MPDVRSKGGSAAEHQWAGNGPQARAREAMPKAGEGGGLVAVPVGAAGHMWRVASS
jgi:hypothetical protein